MAAYVRVPESAYRIMDGSEVMYYTPPILMLESVARRLVDLAETEPTREFYNYVAEQMNILMDGGEVAPEIEPAIMNLIDDKANHRKMALRTGDYIALQRQFMAVQRSA